MPAQIYTVADMRRIMTTRAHRDWLEVLDAESTAKNPEFPSLMEEAGERQALGDRLARERTRQRLSQSAIARRMGTSQPQVSKIEGGAPDAKLSTLQRYAKALGLRLRLTLTTAQGAQRVAGRVARRHAAKVARTPGR
jgi:ribosome-binding protein aMBF1 (putative translation factor)